VKIFKVLVRVQHEKSSTLILIEPESCRDFAQNLCNVLRDRLNGKPPGKYDVRLALDVVDAEGVLR